MIHFLRKRLLNQPQYMFNTQWLSSLIYDFDMDTIRSKANSKRIGPKNLIFQPIKGRLIAELFCDWINVDKQISVNYF